MASKKRTPDALPDYNSAVHEDTMKRDICALVDYWAMQRPFALHFYTNRISLPKDLEKRMKPFVPRRMAKAAARLRHSIVDYVDPIAGSVHLKARIRMELNAGDRPAIDGLIPDAPAAYVLFVAKRGVVRHRAALAKDIRSIDPELHAVPAGVAVLLQPAELPPTDRQTTDHNQGGNLFAFYQKNPGKEGPHSA